MSYQQIEETLKSSDIPSTLMEFIIWSDVLEGARAALVAEQVVYVDKRLIGRDGVSIRVPHASQLTASTKAEDNQMTTSDKTITATVITVDTKVFSAVSLTKELLEDYPSINWVRLQFRNMGRAVQEYVDTTITSLLIDNAGLTRAAATAGTLAYNDVVDGIKQMAAQNFRARWLIVNPAKAGDLLKDTKFINAQNQYYRFSDLLNGEIGEFAGVRVLETTQLAATRCLMVIDPYDSDGPAAIVAYKRDITVTSDTDVDYDRTRWYTTLRVGMGVVRATGILLISST